MTPFSPWHSGHSTRSCATVTRISAGAEMGVNWPAQRLDNKDCTTGRIVHIRRRKWPMTWHKRTCGREEGASGVECAIPVWRNSTSCSGVPSYVVPVRLGSSSCFHSCLKYTSTTRMRHWRKTNTIFLLWWCIRENVHSTAFAATGSGRTGDP